MHTRLDGEALQQARTGKGLSQHQLAKMVHISAGERILDFERGANEPNPRILLALAEALTVEPMQLLLLPNGVDLKALRLTRGLSAANLAESAHVSLRKYIEWEAGYNLPLDNQRILSALARKFGVSRTEIVNALRRCADPDV